MPQNQTEGAGGLPRCRSQAQQGIRARHPRRPQRLDRLGPARVRRHEQGGGGIPVFGQPFPDRGNHAIELGIRLFEELERHPAARRRRIRLRISRRRRFYAGPIQRVPHRLDRMIFAHPADQLVRQADDRQPRTPRIRQLAPDIGLVQKRAQVLRMRRCEGLVDRLVGIADADPVAFPTHQLAQNLLLQGAAVLGFVLEDERPALTQVPDQCLVRVQRPDRRRNQVVEVEDAPHRQTALVAFVHVDRQLDQHGAFLRKPAAHCLRRLPAALELPDGVVRHLPQQLRQVVRRDLVPAVVVHFFDQVPRQPLAIARVRSPKRPAQNGIGDAFVDDGETGLQPDQRRRLRNDLVRQTVKGAHPVAPDQAAAPAPTETRQSADGSCRQPNSPG